MSIVKITRLYCDGTMDECPMYGGAYELDFMGKDSTAEDVRRNARLEGWLVGAPGGRDFCPTCRALDRLSP